MICFMSASISTGHPLIGRNIYWQQGGKYQRCRLCFYRGMEQRMGQSRQRAQERILMDIAAHTKRTQNAG